MTEVGGFWSLTTYCCWCGGPVALEEVYGFFTCLRCVFHRLDGPVAVIHEVLWHSATAGAVLTC